jgi:hypothetical protein
MNLFVHHGSKHNLKILFLQTYSHTQPTIVNFMHSFPNIKSSLVVEVFFVCQLIGNI